MVADLLGSVGVIAAALVILITGWLYADPLVSVLIGLLILASAWTSCATRFVILLEATPRGLDSIEIGTALASVEGVVDVHDLHVWTITSGFPALSAHVLVRRRVTTATRSAASSRCSSTSGSASRTRRSRSITSSRAGCSRSHVPGAGLVPSRTAAEAEARVTASP